MIEVSIPHNKHGEPVAPTLDDGRPCCVRGDTDRRCPSYGYQAKAIGHDFYHTYPICVATRVPCIIEVTDGEFCNVLPNGFCPLGLCTEPILKRPIVSWDEATDTGDDPCVNA